MDPGGATVCIIGAGCSGFTTAKALQDAGVAFDCFEASDNIGGNWYYRNPNGMSGCYQSLHTDSSKHKAQFRDFPMPDEWPDYPHHSQIFDYFNAYVDHFGLREKIQFNTRVVDARPLSDGRWQVETDRGDCRQYDYLLVANGHHWQHSVPEYPGHFNGRIMHSHNYRSPREPLDLQDQRVLVVGFGNSAMDIASELGQRHLTRQLTVSTRRGGHVMPRYLMGRPADHALLPGWVPAALARRFHALAYRWAVGDITRFGLPEPDHQPFEAHPSCSGEFLLRLGNGDIRIQTGIARYDGEEVVFTDGSREAFDVIIFATGYDISFPFLSHVKLPLVDNHIPLFKRLLRPELPNLIFLGLAQSMPSLINLAELQSRLVVPLVTGEYRLPSVREMQALIRADEEEHIGPFYKSRRHTMQLDGARYARDLKHTLAIGKRRAQTAGRREQSLTLSQAS